MRKMRLELDGLQVESFSTGLTDGARGTVQANDQSAYLSCYNTCGDSCQTGNPSHMITCGSGCGGVTNHASCDNSGYKHCGSEI